MSWKKITCKGDVPPARHSTSAALISEGQYAMMFGGCHDSKAFNDTWLLSTGFWIAFFCDVRFIFLCRIMGVEKY